MATEMNAAPRWSPSWGKKSTTKLLSVTARLHPEPDCRARVHAPGVRGQQLFQQALRHLSHAPPNIAAASRLHSRRESLGQL